MPVRPSTSTSPAPLDATVVLEEIGTGRVIELRDSVFRFTPSDSTIGSEGVFFHNYWTTEKIRPGTTYRFTATPEGRPPSEATIIIPADYDIELWLGQPMPGRSTHDVLRLVGLKHLAFVVIITKVGGCTIHNRARIEVPDSPDGLHMLPLGRPNGFVRGCEGIVASQAISIAGSGVAWPLTPTSKIGTLGVSNQSTHVTHATGYLGGVLTHVIPYEKCRILNPAPGDYCRLRFDSTSVTLGGTVTDPVCRDSVSGALVELRELDPEPPTRIRSGSTDRTGAYLISALDPDLPYALTVTDGKGAEFEPYSDTIQFERGEHSTYDVALQRQVAGCG